MGESSRAQGALHQGGETLPLPASSPFFDNLLLFIRTLRRAGLPVSPGQTLSLVRALDWIDLGERREFFHTARAFLVFRHEDLRLFQLVFDRFWRKPSTSRLPQKTPRAPRHDADRRPKDLVALMAARAGRNAAEVEVVDRAGTFSAVEVLQGKDFSELSPEELDRVRGLIQDMRWRVSERQTRRRQSHGRGTVVDLRRTLHQVARTGSLPTRLPRSRRKVKERPVVLLADISGSMERYSRLVLLFFYSIAQGLRDVESFVFGTRLSRITESLRLRNVDRAVDDASRQVVDWAGGTRIGASLGQFNRRWGRRVLRRGAVVIVVSDGWERGDVDGLRREMQHLKNRCHRLIWLNPLLGRPSYQPRVAGMSAALTSVDDFLPIHNLQSIEQLCECLHKLPPGRSRTAGTHDHLHVLGETQ